MAADDRRGLAYGLSAYLIWGCFPLYFPLLLPAGSLEILAHRMAWSAATCAVLLSVLHRWAAVREVLRDGRRLRLIGLAAALISLNWGVYVLAVNTGRVVEAAMGYYINPLMTVLLGVVVLGERLRRLQWAAVAVGAGAVTVLTLEYRHPPVISLTLAASFALYSLAKNRVGRGVDALSGLSLEAGLLTPVALVYLIWLQLAGQSSILPAAPLPGPAPFGTAGWHLLLLASAGVVTVTPLLLFASAARRIPLSSVGLLLYITPTVQFLIGVVLNREPMSPGRWSGFALIWLAVVCLATDTVRQARSGQPVGAVTRTG